MELLEDKNRNRLLNQLLFKILSNNFIDSNFKLIYNEEFLGSIYYDAFKFIYTSLSEQYNKNNNEQIISTQYLVEKYGIIPLENDKTQFEIINQLKDVYFQHFFNKYSEEYNSGLQKADMKAYSKFVDDLTKLKASLEIVKYSDTHDEDYLKDILNDITDTNGYIKIGMEGIDDLLLEKGQLVGILGSTGSGKSIYMQKLNALACKKGYKTAHFTIELTEKLFIKRIITAMTWVSYKNLNIMSDWHKKQVIQKFKNYQKINYATVRHGTINLSKIEKILQTQKPDIVYIDYAQILNEDLDSKSCKIGKELHEFAVRYNCLIIMGLQTNQEGRNRENPPELGDIKWVKSLADDCDVVLSLKGEKLENDFDESKFTFDTKKYRNGTYCKFTFKANLNTGIWKCITLNVDGNRVIENYDVDLKTSGENIDDIYNDEQLNKNIINNQKKEFKNYLQE